MPIALGGRYCKMEYVVHKKGWTRARCDLGSIGLVMDTPIDEKVTQCELSGGEIVINYGSIKIWLRACNLIHKICIER